MEIISLEVYLGLFCTSEVEGQKKGKRRGFPKWKYRYQVWTCEAHSCILGRWAVGRVRQNDGPVLEHKVILGTWLDRSWSIMLHLFAKQCNSERRVLFIYKQESFANIWYKIANFTQNLRQIWYINKKRWQYLDIPQNSGHFWDKISKIPVW